MLGAGYTVRGERQIEMYEGCYELATQQYLKEQAIHSNVLLWSNKLGCLFHAMAK